MVDPIEERIADHLRFNAFYISDKCNPIVKMAAEAAERTIKAARDIDKLLIEIALKQKAFDNETRIQSVQFFELN